MLNNPNALFTDSLERELLAQEMDYHNDAPLQSFVRWVLSGFSTIFGKITSVGTTETVELGCAQK